MFCQNFLQERVINVISASCFHQWIVLVKHYWHGVRHNLIQTVCIKVNRCINVCWAVIFVGFFNLNFENELGCQTFQIVFHGIFEAWFLSAFSVPLQVTVFLQIAVLKWHPLDIKVLMIVAENVNCHKNCTSQEEWDDKDCDCSRKYSGVIVPFFEIQGSPIFS